MSLIKKENPIYVYDEEESFQFNSAIPFICTNSFFSKCTDLGIESEQFLNQLVKQRVFLITYAPNNRNYFHILTEQAILVCVISEDNNFTITGLQEKTVGKQNYFIKAGLKIRAEQGSVLWSGSSRVWKDQVSPNEASSHFKTVKRAFLQKLDIVQEQNGIRIDEEEEFTPISDEFEELLAMAEAYAVAEDEVQKAQAQTGPQISYYDFQAADGYERVEKVAYDFFVADIDQNMYKKGSRVVIQLDEGQEITGVITELQLEKEPLQITVLFDELFQVNQMLPAGVISLEYNSVQLEVRTNVIEDLRNGSSPAKYLDDVIGEEDFAGFEKKDLAPLTERLLNSNRPPNDSQLDAIKRGIETEDALLVLGPPGTGKTTVILEWVKHFVLEEGKRVLISSQNNRAVDNVLERLAEEKDIDTIRVGSEEKIQSNVQHLMYEQRAYELQQTINEANDHYASETESVKQKVKGFLDHLTSLEPVAESLQQTHHHLTKQYENLYQTYVKPLAGLMEKDKLEKQKITTLIEKYKEAKKQVVAFNDSPWWKKSYTFPLWLNAKRVIKTFQSKHGELINRNKHTVQEYNQLQAISEDFREEMIAPHKQKWIVMSNKWKEALASMGELATVDLQGEPVYFSLHEVKQESAQNDILQVKQACEAFYQQLDVIDGALSRWRGFLEEKKNYALSKVLLESVDLVGATCIGINSQQRFQDLDFDVTIIDEAGQIQIQNAIVPISRSKKVIMLGDHLQIPPIADQDVMARCEEGAVETELLKKSFFEYLYNRFPEKNKILLDTQYRMPAEIAELLSEWFYDGEYQSFKGKKGMETPFPNLFNKPFAIMDTGKERARGETKQPGEGYFNRLEAKVVVDLIGKIVREANPADLQQENKVSIQDVGVITPYKLQVKQIREELLAAYPHLTKEQVTALVASLDSFQGQERKVIIYSCTRSNRKKPHQERIGFLKELRRLNVALSRCQEQLVFVGDIPFLSTCEYVMTDEYGETLVDEEGNPMQGTSEKEFSDFIKLMVEYVERGKADMVPVTSRVLSNA
ncbi:DEAD/DEAH box helicase [Ornithinibacillus halophilus]|uniref:AAA domain-containing protein n=1 Tax=Ornithinibacillus halophilus TaxID=930117 RepID=A0A1M5GUE5_9BACI|nr:AAA domain-containing protein [Ornithinibacillus halophilus]SHG07042.1 AAA domain-containing protein [Ornithinibacillus halophilus]